MLYLARKLFRKVDFISPWTEKFQATFVSIIANASIILLALLDRIDVPSFMESSPLPEHFNYQIFVLGAASYLLLYKYPKYRIGCWPFGELDEAFCNQSTGF